MSAPYREGLLHAQRMANEASHKAHQEGKPEVANALAELSTTLLMAREENQEADRIAERDRNRA